MMRTYHSYPEGFSDGHYLTTKEVAAWLGKRIRTIQRYKTEGMPSHAKGSSYLEREIREWLKNHKRKNREK
jgi:hypothetical protein